MYGAPGNDTGGAPWNATASTDAHNPSSPSTAHLGTGVYAAMGAPGAAAMPGAPFNAQRPPTVNPMETTMLGDMHASRFVGSQPRPPGIPTDGAHASPTPMMMPGMNAYAGTFSARPDAAASSAARPPTAPGGAAVRPPGTGPRRGRPPRNPRPPPVQTPAPSASPAGDAPATASSSFKARPNASMSSFTPALSAQQQQALMARAMQLSKAQNQPSFTPLHALFQMGFVFVRNTQLPNVPPGAALGGTILRADEAAALGLVPNQAMAATAATARAQAAGAAGGAPGAPWQPTTMMPYVRPDGVRPEQPGVLRMTPGAGGDKSGAGASGVVNAPVSTVLLPGAPTNVPLVHGGAPPATNAVGMPVTTQNTRLTALPMPATEPYPWKKLDAREVDELLGIMRRDAKFQPVLQAQQKRADNELYAHVAPVLHPRPPDVAPRPVAWWEKSVQEPAAPRLASTHEPFKLVLPAQRQRALEQGVRGVRAPVPLSGAEVEHVANTPETLVPIRLELEHEPFKLRDTFLWNAAEDDASLEAFAVGVCEDLGLPSAVFVSLIRTAVQTQVNEFATAMALRPQATDADAPGAGASQGRGTLTPAAERTWAQLRRTVLRRGEAASSEDATEAEEAPPVVEEETEPEAADATDARARPETAAPRAEAASEAARTPAVAHADASASPASPAPADAPADAALDTPLVAPPPSVPRSVHDLDDELRVLIKLDILVGAQNLVDQFEWDLLDPDAQSAERFAETFAADLGLAGEFKTAIVHAIREQVSTHLRLLFLLGYPFNRLASMDDEVRTAFLPAVDTQHLTRSHGEVDAFTPKLVQLTPADALLLEREHEREMRRKRRQTKGRRGINLAEREPQRTIRSVPVYGLQGGVPDATSATVLPTRRAAAAAASAHIATAYADGGDEVPSTPPAKRIRTERHELHFRYPGGLGLAGEGERPRFRSRVLADTPLDALGRRAPVAAPVPTETAAAARGRPPKDRVPPTEVALARGARPEDLERQHPNMFDGVWHCGNCGMPGYLAPGRRKGPAGEKTLCGPCGKYYHRHRRMENVTYTRDPAYHTKRLKRITGHSEWGVDGADLGDAQATDTGDAPSDATAQGTPGPADDAVHGANDEHDDDPAHGDMSFLGDDSDSDGGDAAAPVAPAWLLQAVEASRRKYPNDCFQIQLRPRMPDTPPPAEEEWRIRCADCPGKVYKPGPGESLINFEIHLKNRSHRAAVARRLGNIGN
ncbi:SWI/SNF chromatin-remodeling complex subunit [Malassezia brasiliensis]|uniref:SWI/SNF chromatin-remodeling complex subunit n=1 Tax=Malassezia brasiliensis TaxID=1821822 RepID=A0AAF0IQB0_9BASI|nr:SWI/SNF chromatin-remodeling complex subunit [Malassezia brasiliensis]